MSTFDMPRWIDCVGGPRTSMVGAAAAIILLRWGAVPAAAHSQPAIDQTTFAALLDKANRSGTVTVIVTLNLPERILPEAQVPDRSAIERQRSAIARAREALLASLSPAQASQVAAWPDLPMVALKVDAAALHRLAGSEMITAIQEGGLASASSPESAAQIARLTAKAENAGMLNVIVGLNLPVRYVSEEQLPDHPAVERQRGAIASVRDALLASLQPARAVEYRKWERLPLIAVRVDAAGLRILAASPLVRTIQEDRRSRTQ